MTREEIMQLNTDYLNGCESEHKMNELFSYALEQQPCDVAVSREAVMRLIENKPYDWSNLTERHNMLMEIRKLPPVTRQTGEWILLAESISKDQYEARLKVDMVAILDKIRAEIAEYGSIWVAYAITDKTKTDKGIEKLVSDVLKQAKEQVLEVIDKYREER